MKKSLFIAVGVVLLFIGCGKKNTPKSVTEEFINEAIIKADYDALKEYVTPQTLNLFQVSMGLTCDVKQKGFDECYEELMKKDKNRVKKAEVVDVKKIDDNHATVDVKEYLSDGSVKTVPYNLVKIDGKWKIGIKK